MGRRRKPTSSKPSSIISSWVPVKMFLIENSTDVRDYAKLGFLFKLLHADDPQHPTSNEVAEVRKQILGSAASGSALILTGVVVSSQTFRFDRKVAWTTAAIVLIQPLFALGITELFHMSRAEIHNITLISAIPGGFFGIVFGKSVNSTPETASSALIASYCVGVFSMAGWMLILTKYF